MPRRPRLYLEGVPQHVTHRGNNRQGIFFGPDDGRRYLEWLAEYSEQHQCAVHAYVLMPNHVHLLITPQAEPSLPKMMQALSARYTQYVNRTHDRSGTLWEGRYHASLIDSEAYLLACYRYIELNPVRAGLAEAPESYLWSSYRANANGDPDPVLSPHPIFQVLLDGPGGREAYRDLIAAGIEATQYDVLHASSLSNRPVGSRDFVARAESELGHTFRAGPGRPKVKIQD
jgi:REP-associated tyrosine transposase